MSVAKNTNGSAVATTEDGIRHIARWEAFRSRPYLDAVKVPTIGFGTTRYPDGRKVALTDKAISQETAITYLMHDVRNIDDVINREVVVPLTPGQFDALASFIYNVGARAFARSTLLRKLNKGEYEQAADELLRWNKAGGQVLQGLTNRRRSERELFLG